MITSTSNSQVKQVSALGKRGKQRKETGLFVVEGPRMFRELPPEQTERVYMTEHFLKDPAHEDMISRIGKAKTELVTEEVLKAMSDTQTPQGVIAVVRQYRYSLTDILKTPGPPLLMILETLQDPGNLGTILRAGEGAGITGIIMNCDTADIYNPKVIRSTMGSIYRVPFVYTDNLPETLQKLKTKKIRLYAAHLEGQNTYDQETYTGPAGFLIGNEGKGLTEETAASADTWIRIPMKGAVESLNAAVASSVLMFEAARQRRVASTVL